VASLIQRGKTYYIQYMASGRAKRISTGIVGDEKYPLAKEKLRQFESAQFRGEDHLLPTKTPTAEILTAYVEHIRVAKTAKSAQTDIYYLRDAFGPACDALKITSRNPQPGRDESQSKTQRTRPAARQAASASFGCWSIA
jgi:hypothetical protein